MNYEKAMNRGTEVSTLLEINNTNKKVLRAGAANASTLLFALLICFIGLILFSDENSLVSIPMSIVILIVLVCMLYLYYSSTLCKVVVKRNKLILVTPLISKTYVASKEIGIKLIKSQISQIISLNIGTDRLFKRNFTMLAFRTNLGDLDESYEALEKMIENWRIYEDHQDS